MRHRNAFTLIELLVVIAIISLLVSILLPSLNRAKELARRAVCMSNQKALLVALHIYANEFDEALPFDTLRLATGNTVGGDMSVMYKQGWWSSIGMLYARGGVSQPQNEAMTQGPPETGYTGGVHEVFYCPSAHWGDMGTQSAKMYGIDYWDYWHSADVSAIGGWALHSSYIYRWIWQQKLSDVQSQGHNAIFGDSWAYWYTHPQGVAHEGKVFPDDAYFNIAYLDGHVSGLVAGSMIAYHTDIGLGAGGAWWSSECWERLDTETVEP